MIGKLPEHPHAIYAMPMQKLKARLELLLSLISVYTSLPGYVLLQISQRDTLASKMPLADSMPWQPSPFVWASTVHYPPSLSPPFVAIASVPSKSELNS